MYSQDEMEQIIHRSSKLLGVDAQDYAVSEIARRARSTPRTANYFLKRCRDYAQVHKGSLDTENVKKALELLGVDDLGLFESDRNLLKILIQKFNGGPVGLKTLAAATGDEESTIEDVVEPYLIQLGFIERTARGRVATEKAYKHLNLLQD
jgi:Holliday junction DNA helicase RuvB